MTTEHPITPPPELTQEWSCDCPLTDPFSREFYVATQAARWGADQELEALLDLADGFLTGETLRQLRAARRPKPPSLKEQALLQLDTLNADLSMHGLGCDLSQIRRALEALPDE